MTASRHQLHSTTLTSVTRRTAKCSVEASGLRLHPQQQPDRLRSVEFDTGVGISLQRVHAGADAAGVDADRWTALGQRVAGAGAYVMWNDLIYAEFDLYRGLGYDVLNATGIVPVRRLPIDRWR